LHEGDKSFNLEERGNVRLGYVLSLTLTRLVTTGMTKRGAFDIAKNHKRQRRKRQSVTAKREKSQTPKFV